MSSVRAQEKKLGVFQGRNDVGSPARAGNTVYDAEKQEYVVEGAGSNMWANRDEFQFVWKQLKGDFILTSTAAFIGKGVEQHRKIGWIVRSSMDPDSAQASVVLHGDGLTSLQFRRTKNGTTEELRSKVQGPDVLQLERKGNTYKMSVARSGDALSSEEVSLDLGDDVYVGLFVCSHNKNVAEKAVFKNVRITVPAPDNFTPYRDYIGSNLEVMDVTTGIRKVVYS
ncbi:MAG TPA: hypothetical protein VFH91_02990, partial [Pyrinomonadaceae bacterium]|nr:hypothetical protein [Pyrinomonadaceae bacterium]